MLPVVGKLLPGPVRFLISLLIIAFIITASCC
jgi:hypothetical protein